MQTVFLSGQIFTLTTLLFIFILFLFFFFSQSLFFSVGFVINDVIYNYFPSF